MAQATLIKAKDIIPDFSEKIIREVSAHQAAGTIPHLVSLIASSDLNAANYARTKVKKAQDLGIKMTLTSVDPAQGQSSLDRILHDLARDPLVHGIILELPLDPVFDLAHSLAQISPLKDVDGLTPQNLGYIAAGREDRAILPATPQSCIALAETQINLAGKQVAVIGRGASVGRGLIPMLINRDATVLCCHSRSGDLTSLLSSCDVIFSATGRASLLTRDHVHPGQIVIDAGMNYDQGRPLGDADPEIDDIIAARSPVPGGVGPLTGLYLFANLLRAMNLQKNPSLFPQNRP